LRSYVREGVAERVRAAGGEIYAITSEPQTLASRAAREWRLDFETAGDPHQEIVGACREHGWLDLFVNERVEFLQASTRGRDFEPSHLKGYLQPGVLALAGDGRVLYRWRSGSFRAACAVRTRSRRRVISTRSSRVTCSSTTPPSRVRCTSAGH
jgi:hypothetical protein